MDGSFRRRHLGWLAVAWGGAAFAALIAVAGFLNAGDPDPGDTSAGDAAIGAVFVLIAAGFGALIRRLRRCPQPNPAESLRTYQCGRPASICVDGDRAVVSIPSHLRQPLRVPITDLAATSTGTVGGGVRVVGFDTTSQLQPMNLALASVTPQEVRLGPLAALVRQPLRDQLVRRPLIADAITVRAVDPTALAAVLHAAGADDPEDLGAWLRRRRM